MSLSFGNISIIYWSTYDLLSPLYSSEILRQWCFNCKNAGGYGFRIFAMIDGAEMYVPTWRFGPWKSNTSAYYDFTCYDEDYFKRLKFLLETAKSYNLQVIFTLYLAQRTPLDSLELDLPSAVGKQALEEFSTGKFDSAWNIIEPYKGIVLYTLKDFMRELKKRELDRDIYMWELCNECGDWKLIFIPQLARALTEIINPKKVMHSGEAPGLLSPFYDYYSPHNWGGSRPLRTLARNRFNDPGEIQYLKSLQKVFKVQIIPSSDGCMPDLYNQEQIDEIISALIERNMKAWEVDLGWFTKNTEKIENVEWDLAYKFTERVEQRLKQGVGGYLSLTCNPYKKITCPKGEKAVCERNEKTKRWEWICKQEFTPEPEPINPCKKKLIKMNLRDIFNCLLWKIRSIFGREK